MRPPGVGHQWPVSIEVAVYAMGSIGRAAAHFGFAVATMKRMLAREMFPVLEKHQDRFFAKGWTEYELPWPEPDSQDIKNTAFRLSSSSKHMHDMFRKLYHQVAQDRIPEYAVKRRVLREEPIIAALVAKFLRSGARGPAHANRMAWAMVDAYGFDSVEKKLLEAGIDLTLPQKRLYNG